MKRTRTRAIGVVVFAALALIAACADREEILQGQRLDLRAPPDAAAEPEAPPVATAVAISLPPQTANASWTHRGGSVEHRLTHPALGQNLTLAWRAGIGAGDGRKQRITAEPVVADGRIFTLDAAATVTAVGLNGAVLWSRDLTPSSETAGEGSGGGLAFDDGRLFVTLGFGSLTALDPATGAEIWVQKFDAPVSSAPTVQNGLVFVVAEDSSAWAVDAGNGKLRWQLPGTPSVAGMVGGSGPALAGRLVILPFPSGEVQGALSDSGQPVWTANVAGKRVGRAYTGVPDITGAPVVVGEVIYIGNQSGRVAALEAGSGKRIWTAREGAYSALLPVGGSLFLISDEAKLVRLDAGTGAPIWSVDLPYFTADKVKKRKGVFAHYGPVLAGGRLIVASDDGLIRQFDPASGALIATVALPGPAATDPVVAGGVLYLVSTDGALQAFR